MKRSDDLEIERRAFLKQELKEYEKTVINLTPDEKKELREWIKRGRSVYDNPWYISTGNGWPLDYVEARRTFEEILSNPDVYNSEETAYDDSNEYLETDDLPFGGSCC